MNLGLSELTDDQLVELLQEACNELAQRDPIVRKAAQETIDKEAIKLKVLREEASVLRLTRESMEEDLRYWITQAIERTKKQYQDQLEKDVAEFVKEEIKAGRYRVMDSKEEAQRIANAANVVPVRIHVSPGYSPQGVADALESLYNVATPERDGMATLKCMMNGEQIEKFKETLGISHRIELL